MGKTFEDYFSELQADMVSVCLEYVDNRADNIYIYCSYEPEMYEFNVFYKVDGKIVPMHELKVVVTKSIGVAEHVYRVSANRQFAVLNIGIENIKKIHDKCIEFNKDMPTEMKLYYDVEENSLKGTYRYDLVYSDDEELLPMHIFMSWFEEVKKDNL